MCRGSTMFHHSIALKFHVCLIGVLNNNTVTHTTHTHPLHYYLYSLRDQQPYLYQKFCVLIISNYLACPHLTRILIRDVDMKVLLDMDCTKFAKHTHKLICEEFCGLQWHFNKERIIPGSSRVLNYSPFRVFSCSYLRRLLISFCANPLFGGYTVLDDHH